MERPRRPRSKSGAPLPLARMLYDDGRRPGHTEWDGSAAWGRMDGELETRTATSRRGGGPSETAAFTSASGRRGGGASRCVFEGGRRHRGADARRRTAISPATSPPPAPAPSTASGSTTTERRTPTRPRASSRRGRTARRRSSTRRPSAGPTAAGAASACDGQVIYEMHVGTFTPEGTWEAAGARAAGAGRPRHHGARGDAGGRLPRPLRLGLRRRQPVRPDAALRHARRLPPLRRSRPRRWASASSSTWSTTTSAPTATTSSQFSEDYFTDRYKNEWGEAINFDGADAGPVREFFIANAGYWIDEFHLDGLRLDATQQIFDDSPDHILAAIGRRGPRGGARPGHAHRRRERAAGRAAWSGRSEQGGYGLDAPVERRLPPQRHGRPDRPQRGLLHRLSRHAAGVHLGGQVGLPLPGPALHLAEEAARHAGARPAAGAVRHLPREPRPGRQLGPRPAAAPADQPRPLPGDDGAAAAGPGTPMLFQGQEFAASSPFLYFADHNAGAGPAGAQGPGRVPRAVPQPRRLRRCRRRCPTRPTRRRSSAASSTFRSGKRTPECYALHRDLLRLRREDPVFRAAAAARRRRGRARRRRRSCCASSATAATTGCCW